MLPSGFSSKLIKSSSGSFKVLLSLQSILSKLLLRISHWLEQEPGSVSRILREQLLSLGSVKVIVISPAPAEPFCRLKLVLTPIGIELGEMLPVLTVTNTVPPRLLPVGLRLKSI